MFHLLEMFCNFLLISLQLRCVDINMFIVSSIVVKCTVAKDTSILLHEIYFECILSHINTPTHVHAHTYVYIHKHKCDLFLILMLYNQPWNPFLLLMSHKTEVLLGEKFWVKRTDMYGIYLRHFDTPYMCALLTISPSNWWSQSQKSFRIINFNLDEENGNVWNISCLVIIKNLSVKFKHIPQLTM